MLKDRGKFVTFFLSHALGIFGVMAVCACAFEERGFCRTVHLSCITLKKRGIFVS